MNKYYLILGVTPNASIDTIKKAYRQKAKLLHPDINKAEDAQEQFILLNEAYEYLINTAGRPSYNKVYAQRQAQKRADFQKKWEQKEREKARAKAKEYAKMKYEAYLKSDVYKATEAINVVLDFIGFLFVLLFLLVMPALAYIEHGPVALLFATIILLPTSPLWFSFLVKTLSRINYKMLFKMKNASLQSRTLRLTIFIFLNTFILFKITLNTLIQLHWIIILYSLSITIAHFITLNNKSRLRRFFIRYALAPGFINAIFLINYLVSFNPTEEIYPYEYNNNAPVIFVNIKLKNNAMQKYQGVRFFLSKESIHRKHYVRYIIKDGVFGLQSAHNIKLYTYLPEDLHQL